MRSSKDSCSKTETLIERKGLYQGKQTMFAQVNLAPGVERESCLCRRATTARGDRWVPTQVYDVQGATTRTLAAGEIKGARGCALPCAPSKPSSLA